METGVRYAEGNSSFSAVVYRNTVNNLITFVSAPGPCAAGTGAFPGCYSNTAHARYSGMTFAGTYRVSSAVGDVDLHGSLDLQNPRDLTTGKQLPRRARQHANFGADWRAGTWLIGAEAQLQGQRYSGQAETLSLPGYALLNLSASTRLATDWTLLARLDNAADKQYQTASSYATQGRSLYVGAKWAPQQR